MYIVTISKRDGENMKKGNHTKKFKDGDELNMAAYIAYAVEQMDKLDAIYIKFIEEVFDPHFDLGDTA
jgi:hypothetical protein